MSERPSEEGGPCLHPSTSWSVSLHPGDSDGGSVCDACGRVVHPDFDPIHEVMDWRAEPQCDGLCVTGADAGVPVWDYANDEQMVAYPHPSCPRHAPGQVCECGQPDRCLSPTHAPGFTLLPHQTRSHELRRGTDADCR